MLLGALIQHPFKTGVWRRRLRLTIWFFATCGWIVYAALLAYWYLSVVPGLDGTEGSGVGFGAVYVHVGGVMPALFFTGFMVALLVIDSASKNVHS